MSMLVIIINGDIDERQEWTLGDVAVKRTTEYKYLGLLLNEKGTEKAKSEILFKGKLVVREACKCGEV